MQTKHIYNYIYIHGPEQKAIICVYTSYAQALVSLARLSQGLASETTQALTEDLDCPGLIVCMHLQA